MLDLMIIIETNANVKNVCFVKVNKEFIMPLVTVKVKEDMGLLTLRSLHNNHTRTDFATTV